MHPHVNALFEFTRSRVSERHIADFSPNDPGYHSYVRLWTRIRRSGAVPTKTEFDLSEVIGLTGWANPNEFSDPDRFREYRRFTSAVAIALIHLGNDTECVRPANYVARDLIVDCDSNELEHLQLVRSVFPITRDVLAATNCEVEYPFFTFGELILAQMANDHDDATRHAAELIADESAVRNNESLNWCLEDSRFLLGLTNYDQLHADWIRFATKLSNPRCDTNIQLVIDAITDPVK
jgi:hypothetical protein